MWIRIRIKGNRDIQKKHHKNLRSLIRELLETKIIQKFVMTYHSSILYFCVDVPSLSECSMSKLRTITGFTKIIAYLDSSCQYEAPDKYLDAIKVSISERLQNYQLKVPETVLIALAKTELDNAVRGCNVALEILTGGISINKDPILFNETIRKACLPLNGGWIISKSSHFCFNSLAINNIEEFAIEYICTESKYLSDIELSILKDMALKALTRLEFREPYIFQDTK